MTNLFYSTKYINSLDIISETKSPIIIVPASLPPFMLHETFMAFTTRVIFQTTTTIVNNANIIDNGDKRERGLAIISVGFGKCTKKPISVGINNGTLAKVIVPRISTHRKLFETIIPAIHITKTSVKVEINCIPIAPPKVSFCAR